jgi:hypothetical protein
LPHLSLSEGTFRTYKKEYFSILRYDSTFYLTRAQLMAEKAAPLQAPGVRLHTFKEKLKEEKTR